MSLTANETITVVKPVVGKYGAQVLVGKDKYYSFGKFYKDGELQAGKTYEVEVYTSDKGYKSINTMLKELVNQSTTHEDVAEAKAKEKAKKSPAEAAMKYEDDKSTRILVQGLYQAFASNPGLINLYADAESFEKGIQELTLKGMEFVLKTVSNK